MVAGLNCAAGPPPLPLPNVHLEQRPESAWHVVFDEEHGPFHGDIYFAVPPNDPCQTVTNLQFFAKTGERNVAAMPAVDAGPLKKPLLRINIKAVQPIRLHLEMDVQIFATELKPGISAMAIPPLSAAEQAVYLDDGWPNDQARDWFIGWMRSNNLVKNAGESDLVFAYRVLDFIDHNFRYEIPEPIPAHKLALERDHLMGDWHYVIETKTGECWRLSDVYCRVMRMNGIPARLVSGNWLNSGSHHLRSLIYSPRAGWIPVEVTGAVCSPKKSTATYFGHWGGPMLVGNQNINFVLPNAKTPGRIGTFDGIAFGDSNGHWDFSKASFVVTRTDVPAGPPALNTRGGPSPSPAGGG